MTGLVGLDGLALKRKGAKEREGRKEGKDERWWAQPNLPDEGEWFQVGL
jgi:hypothetical protein